MQAHFNFAGPVQQVNPGQYKPAPAALAPLFQAFINAYQAQLPSSQHPQTQTQPASQPMGMSDNGFSLHSIPGLGALGNLSSYNPYSSLFGNGWNDQGFNNAYSGSGAYTQHPWMHLFGGYNASSPYGFQY